MNCTKMKFIFKDVFNKCQKICKYDRIRSYIQVNIYSFIASNRSARKRCEICSNLIIKAPEQRHWHCSVVFNVGFEHISFLFLKFLLFTLNKKILAEVLNKTCKKSFKQYRSEKTCILTYLGDFSMPFENFRQYIISYINPDSGRISVSHKQVGWRWGIKLFHIQKSPRIFLWTWNLEQKEKNISSFEKYR